MTSPWRISPVAIIAGMSARGRRSTSIRSKGSRLCPPARRQRFRQQDMRLGVVDGWVGEHFADKPGVFGHVAGFLAEFACGAGLGRFAVIEDAAWDFQNHLADAVAELPHQDDLAIGRDGDHQGPIAGIADHEVAFGLRRLESVAVFADAEDAVIRDLAAGKERPTLVGHGVVSPG